MGITDHVFFVHVDSADLGRYWNIHDFSIHLRDQRGCFGRSHLECL